MVENSRPQQVALLWDLKTRFDAFSAGDRIRFPLLLRDAAYRREVLKRALQSGDPNLQELGGKLMSFTDQGALLQDPAVWRRTVTASQPVQPRSRRALVACGLLVVIALVCSVAATWYYLATPTVVSGSIVEDTVWSRGREYRLSGPVYVEGTAVLTIEPGVTVRGAFGSSLVITRNAQIAAAGNANEPIVFTSARPEGEREAGDWGGIILLGNATLNQADARIEGIPVQDERGHFGGDDDLGSCGVLQYARIEFAGYEVYADNELNGLTLGGCGSGTIVRNVQVHRALDDGIEVFGGTVDLRNIVITQAGDDGLDWDLGWRGRVQHLIVQQSAGIGDSAIEGDNNSKQPGALPQSRPLFYNVTLLGERHAGEAQRAMVLRSGTGASFNNLLVQGFFHEAVDLRGEVVTSVENGTLTIGSALFANIGPSGTEVSQREEGAADDDGGFDESGWIAALPGVQLQAKDALSRYPRETLRTIRPERLPALLKGAAVSHGEFWQEGSRYIGAQPPGVTESWLSQWLDFAER